MHEKIELQQKLIKNPRKLKERQNPNYRPVYKFYSQLERPPEILQLPSAILKGQAEQDITNAFIGFE